MKPWKRGAIFGLALLISACKSGPQATECIVTIDDIGFDARSAECISSQADVSCFRDAFKLSIIADCIKPDKTFSVKRGAEIDGHYLYSPHDKAIILKWARANCRQEDE